MTQRRARRSKIYRIENQYGLGPYRYGGEVMRDIAGLDNHGVSNGHPAPTNDPPIQRRIISEMARLGSAGGWYCGFKSVTQLLTWFTEEQLNIMDKYGFRLTTYLAPEDRVLKGDTQVIFRKEGAEKTWEGLWNEQVTVSKKISQIKLDTAPSLC
jgi:hypothetical protein